MSGPKLMHITNDPKVIQRINNRLNTIGHFIIIELIYTIA